MISRERLDQLLEYRSDLGGFVRKKRVGKGGGKWKEGARAGYISKQGYRLICLDYDDYFEHNLVWFVVKGEWPAEGFELDHINRCKSDNRPGNLRLATRAQNIANVEPSRRNRTGIRGVYFDTQRQKYAAQLRINGKIRSLGRFASKEEAANVLKDAHLRHWGEFSIHAASAIGGMRG